MAAVDSAQISEDGNSFEIIIVDDDSSLLPKGHDHVSKLVLSRDAEGTFHGRVSCQKGARVGSGTATAVLFQTTGRFFVQGHVRESWPAGAGHRRDEVSYDFFARLHPVS